MSANPPSNSNDPPPASPGAPLPPAHDPYAALRIGGFRRYLVGNLLSVLGLQMQSAVVMWEVYHRTGSKAMLGLVGLAQVSPVLLLALVAGHAADRFPRKLVLSVALAVMAAGSLGLAAVSLLAAPIWMLYACLVVVGVGRAFQQPAKSSFLPQIVPRQCFPNAVTWSMTGFQLAAAVGPAVGGQLLVRVDLPAVVYAVDAATALLFVALLAGVSWRRNGASSEPLSLSSLSAGARYLFGQRLILSAISLDLFAVLLGGATALLPVYAEEILHVDAAHWGALQSAPAVGALVMAILIAHRPPMRRAGLSLLWAVCGFGVATIVFGWSTNYWLSLAALFLTGAFDNVSVVVRHSLVQLLTPDQMRGRVSAVNGMFISASNELGGMESAFLASATSPVFSVVFGGFGTLAVVAAVAHWTPELRRYGKLVEPAPPAAEPAAAS